LATILGQSKLILVSGDARTGTIHITTGTGVSETTGTENTDYYLCQK